MDVETLERRRREVIEQYGPWRLHSFELAEGVSTIVPPLPGVECNLSHVLQIAADLAGAPLDRLRVLDLGCAEGMYAVEFARHGATVVGVEGREPSVARACFAQEALGLANLRFVQDDVRNVSIEKYGEFDVVLCLGILYHLSAEDAASLVERIFRMCRRVAVVNTQVGMAPRQHVVHRGHDYWGRAILEHRERASHEERAGALWGSIGNNWSFWFTRSSLLNLLQDVGFTSVFECYLPALPEKLADRLTLVALKGTRSEVLSAPAAPEAAPPRCSEGAARRVHPAQRWFYAPWRAFSRFVPPGVKHFLARALGYGRDLTRSSYRSRSPRG